MLALSSFAMIGMINNNDFVFKPRMRGMIHCAQCRGVISPGDEKWANPWYTQKVGMGDGAWVHYECQAAFAWQCEPPNPEPRDDDFGTDDDYT